MKTSVIYKVGGNDPDRFNRLQHSSHSLMQCDADYEVILVEQVMDGNKYYDSAFATRYCPIEAPGQFNVAWCGNVGARLATGDRILFMDADIIVPPGYLDELDKMDIPQFAHGSSWYTALEWGHTYEYYAHEDFEEARRCAKLYTHNQYMPTVDPYLGHGYIRVFDKAWYWDVLGGHVEDFLVWGFEDSEIILHRVHYMMGLDLEDIPALNTHCLHLYHDGPRDQGYVKNFPIFEALKSYRAIDRCELLKRLRVGDSKRMKPLLPHLEGIHVRGH